MSNLRAEGLNNANRVPSEVACMFLARKALEDAGLEQIIPAVYAWGMPKSINVIEEENFGWVVSEHKEGEDLDSQLPSLSQDEKGDLLNRITKLLKALQATQIPSSVEGFGGLSYDAQGNIVSAQMALMKGGPFPSYADLWATKLQAQLDESKDSPVLNGWETDGIAERLGSFIARGVATALDGVALHERTLVHGDFSKCRNAQLEIVGGFLTGNAATNNLLYDIATREISGFLDFDWAVVSHPAEEFFSGFRDIGGCLTDEPKGILPCILKNDFSQTPGGLSEEDLKQWEAAKAWATVASKNGVRLPSDIAGIGQIKALHDLSSAICPFELSSTVMLKRLSDDVKETKKQESQEAIAQFLESRGF